MISKRCSIAILLLLCTTVVFIVYQCEKLSLFYLSLKFINQSNEDLALVSNDLNNCILSFFIFYNLQLYLENKNQSLPIYLSFHSKPLPYDKLGKECTSLFYKGQEKLLMKSYDQTCFYPFPIKNKEREEIQTALNIIKWNFEKNHLELVLTGGSFIGSWRYHQMIPYDDDIDFYVLSNEKPMIKVLLEILSQNKTNRFVFKDTEEQNQHWKLGILCGNITINTCKIQVDFFFMWETGLELQFLEWPKSFTKSDYLPLRKRPFENILFDVPKNFEYYMKTQYKSSSKECVFKNHAENNQCEKETINCDLLKYKYPYKIIGKYRNVLIELIIHKIHVQSLFIDYVDTI